MFRNLFLAFSGTVPSLPVAMTLFETWVAPFFYYKTTKRIKIRYWQAGLAYYALSFFLALFYAQAIFNNGEYLVREPVVARTNAFAATSSHPSRTCGSASDCLTVRNALMAAPYCSSESYRFIYSDDFRYETYPSSRAGPECRETDIYELNTKKSDYISFSTVFTEKQLFGWPCSTPANDSFVAAATAQCDDAPRSDPRTPDQCECTIAKAVFPAAVEDYTVQFHHGYTVTNLNGATWYASSEIANVPNKLDTTILWPNGTVRAYPAGTEIALTVKEIVKMAGKDLDEDNENVANEPGSPGKYPKYRHTGMAISVMMDYTNRDSGELIFALDQDVDVIVNVTLQARDWTSIGPKTFYPSYPVGADDAKQYHRVIRYPQDIEINFVARGYAYALNWVHLVETLIALVVLVGIATSIMDAIVFYIIPGVSTVLRNKRDELTSRESAFRELGMRAALSVKQFHQINDGTPGDLNLIDLVKVFGEVEGVSRQRSMEIAKTILQKNKTLSFNEFMTITEGSTIPFDAFLEMVRHTARGLSKLDVTETADAMQAYSEVEQGISLEGGPAPAPAAAPAGPPMPTPAPRPTPAQIQPIQQFAMPPTVMQPVQQMLPPGVVKLACGTCGAHFGVPPSAKMVRCPHCHAINNTSLAALGTVQNM